MENKRGNVSIVFLAIAIILIVVMGAFVYMQKTESDRQIAELENNASKMQETINDLQGKIDTISKTINSDKEVDKNSTETTKYVELTSALNGKDVLYVTKAEKNDNKTYTLYGVVFKCDGETETQIGYEWSETKEYKKITIPSNTICISGYPEREETIVGEYFKNYEEVEVENAKTPYDKVTYTFEFKNGKCVKVIDFCTSV